MEKQVLGGLHKGEKIQKEITPHPLSYLGYYILGGLFIFLYFIGIFIILIVELVRRGHKYYITNERLIHQFTFISRKTSSIRYDKIQDIHLTQGLLERIFKIGKIYINTAGTTFIEMVFKGVKSPAYVKRIIEENIEKEHKGSKRIKK